MRKSIALVSMLCLTLIVLLNACKKDDDPKFSSAEGNWTYTSPKGEISVDFTLVKSGTTWSVTNPVIRVDGTSGNAEVTFDLVDPTIIESIRINANDSKLTYDYYIEFKKASVNSDFTQITATATVYTWPIDQTNVVSGAVITRR